MKVSASQAAKMFGKSVPTITRAIKRGDLSAEKVNGGGYRIDVSDLTRLWDAVTPESDAKPDTLGDERGSETRVLEVKLEASEAMNQRLLDELADMKEQREKWEREAAHWHDQTKRLQLEPPSASNPAPQDASNAADSKSWLGRLLGGKSKGSA